MTDFFTFQKRFLVLSFFLLLTGCSTLMQPTATLTPQAVQASPHWAVSGRISVRQNHQLQQANIVWKQDKSHYRIDFFGPLGLGRTFLEGDTRNACLQTPQQKTCAQNPEQLMQKTLGWSLPLYPLRDWIFGLPLPKTPAISTQNDQHLLKTLTQKGWQIEYVNYKNFSGALLPNHIRMTYADLEAQIIVDQWTFTHE